MKKIVGLVLLVIMTITGCASEDYTSIETSGAVLVTNDNTTLSTINETIDEAVNEALYSIDNYVQDRSVTSEIMIQLNGLSAIFESNNVVLDKETLTIVESGTYQLSGYYEGQIIVDTKADEAVVLIFDNLTIHQENTSPIYIKNAKQAVIVLKEGTINELYDSSAYMADEENVDEDIERLNGAIYSKEDLLITGLGKLVIETTEKSGILGKDRVIITSGDFIISAGKNGIKGKDFLYILKPTIEIVAFEDGLKSDELVVLNEPTITLKVEDDGIHSDALLQINGGYITISDSYEGLEALDMVINGGDINVNASDDAINTAVDGTTKTQQEAEEPNAIRQGKPPVAQEGMPPVAQEGMPPVRPNPLDMQNTNSGHGLYINGGSLTLNSYGDGLDSNGNIWMTGGTVVVSGPIESRDGSIDYDVEFLMSGGTVVAIGSIGMVQAPSTSSTINSMVIGLETIYQEGSKVEIKNSQNESVMAYEAPKVFQSIVFASADITLSETYYIYIDGKLTMEVLQSESVTTSGVESQGPHNRP